MFLCLKSVVVDFTSPYTDDLVHGGDENLSVADLSGSGVVRDRLDHGFRHLAAARDLDLDFGQEIHRVFRTTVDFGMPFLAPITLHFADGHALDAERRQCFAHFVELERLDDGRDEFHAVPLSPWNFWLDCVRSR